MIEFRKIDLNWVKFNFYFFSKINFILKRSNNQLFELEVKYTNTLCENDICVFNNDIFLKHFLIFIKNIYP